MDKGGHCSYKYDFFFFFIFASGIDFDLQGLISSYHRATNELVC